MMPKGFKFELMEVLEKTLEQHRKKNIGLANYQFKRPEIQNEKKQERIFQKYRQRRQRERLETHFSQHSSPQANKEKLLKEEERTWKSLQQVEKIRNTDTDSFVETKKLENNKNSSLMFRRNPNQAIEQENSIGDVNFKKKKLQDENQNFQINSLVGDDNSKICIGDDNYKGQLKLKVNTTKNKSLIVSGNTNTRTHSSQFDGLSEEVKSIDNQLLFKHQARITLQEGYESILFKEDDQLDFYSIMVKLLEAILDHEVLKKILPRKPKFLQRPDNQFPKIREITKENEGEGYLSFKDILQRLRYKKYGPGKNSIRMGMVLSNIRSVYVICNKYFVQDLESQKISKTLENFFENEIASVLQFRQTISGEVLVSLKNTTTDKNQMKQQWPITSLDTNIIKNQNIVKPIKTQQVVSPEILSNKDEQISEQSQNSKQSESKRQQKYILKEQQKKLNEIIANKGSTTESESSFHPLVKNKTLKTKKKEKKKLKKEQKRLLKQESETVSSNSSSADKEEMEKKLALFNIITKELTNEQKKQIIPIVKPDCLDQKNKQKFEFDLFSLSPQVFTNLEQFVNQCIAKKQQSNRHLYDLSKPNEPYIQDRRILKEKICMLNLEQLRGIIPIVKDKALQRQADEDDLKLEFDLFDLEESKCKELHNYIEVCLQSNDKEKEKQTSTQEMMEPVSPKVTIQEIETRQDDEEVNEELMERLSLFNEIKQLDQQGLDLLGFVMTHPDFLSIGQGLKNGEMSAGQQLEVNCGDTIMLDLKELNIVKVRFLKKLLNDNQMKALYSQMLLQQQQGDLQANKNQPQLNFDNKQEQLNNQLQKTNEVFEKNLQQNNGQNSQPKIGSDFILNIQPHQVNEENMNSLYDNNIFQKEQEEASKFYAEQEQIFLNNEQQLQEQVIDQHNQLEQTQILTRQISELLYFYHERINPNPEINIQNLIKNIEALPENIRCLDFSAAQETLRCSLENEEILKQNITNLEEFRKSQLLIWSEFLNSQKILQKQRIQQHLTWLVDKDKNAITQNPTSVQQNFTHQPPKQHVNTTVKQPSPQIMKQELFQPNQFPQPVKLKQQDYIPEKVQNSPELANYNDQQLPTNETPLLEHELQELYLEFQQIQNQLSQMEQIHAQLTSLHEQKLQFLKPDDKGDELKQIEDSITQVVTQYNSLCDQQTSNQQKILEIQAILEEQQAKIQSVPDSQKYMVDYQNLIQNQVYPAEITQEPANLGYQFVQPNEIQMASQTMQKDKPYYSNGEPVMKMPIQQVEQADITPQLMIPQVNGVFQQNQQFQNFEQEQQQYFYDPETNQVYYADNDGLIYLVDQGQIDLQKPEQQANYYYEVGNQNNDNQSMNNHQNQSIYYNFAIPQDVQQNQEFVFEEPNQQNQQYFQESNQKQFLNQDKSIKMQAQRPLVIISQPDQQEFKNQQSMNNQLEQTKVWPQNQDMQAFQTDHPDKSQNMQEVELQLQQMLNQQHQYGEEVYYMNEGDYMYKPYYVTREGMMVEDGQYQQYPVMMYDQGQGEMYYYQGYEDQKERKTGEEVLNTRELEDAEQSQALVARN